MESTRIEDKARAVMANPLDYPGLAKRNGMQTLVRFWHDPSFEPCRSWSLHVANETYFVRRIVWDQHPSSSLEGPATYASESIVASDLASKLMARLFSIQVSPFLPNIDIGIDGEMRGIEFGSYWLFARLSWWCDPPSGWEPLRDWFADAESQLDYLLPVHVDNWP